MTHDSPQVAPIETNRPRRRWYQFSLRTFLFLTIVVGGLLAQVSLEVAAARKKSQAIARLQAGGYEVECEPSSTLGGRWITSFVPRAQWDTWFPHGDCERFSSVTQIPSPYRPPNILLNQEVFRSLNAFESCPELRLVSYDPRRDVITAKSISNFQGYKGIESLTVIYGCIDDSALKELATSSNLKRVRFHRVTGLSRAKLIEFLENSQIESLDLDSVTLVGDAPWRAGDSLKRVMISNMGLEWHDLAELLRNSQLESLHVEWNMCATSKVNEKWNSKSRKKLTLSVIEIGDLDLLGDLPSLEDLCLGPVLHVAGAKTYIGGSPLKTRLFHDIGKLTALRNLRLSQCGNQGSLDPISSLVNLETIDSDVYLTQDDVLVLRKLPRLKELRLWGPHSLETMTPLLDCAGLRKLSFFADTSSQASIDSFLRQAGERGVLATFGTRSSTFSSNTYLKTASPTSEPDRLNDRD